MAGLLDFENPNNVGAMKLGLGLLSAGGPSRMPVSLGQAIGTAGNDAMDAMKAARQEQVMSQMRNLQMQELMRKALADQERIARLREFSKTITDPIERAAFESDPDAYVKDRNSVKSFDPSHNIYRGGQLIKEGVPKEDKLSAYGKILVEGGEVAGSPSFQKKMQDYAGASITEKTKSVAPTISPKIELKMGESVVGPIGPMLKDSKIAAVGAMKMNDAADRILKAIDTNQVSSGPLTSVTMTVKQFLNPSGGKETENIRQTRQVIRALAESSVEARKELQGQGQVTENEALAVQKAMSGDIDSLTIGELRDIANLNKKMAAFRGRMHKQMLDSLVADENTKKYVPFYSVPGMDVLTPKRITSDAEYNALKSGDVFIDPQGKERRKP